MLDLIEDLTNTASSMQQCFTGNGHEFDELIMRRWSAIRSEAIREGVFSVGDTQEDLFEKINNNLFISKDDRIVTILNTVERMFVTNLKVDAFIAEYDEQIRSKPEYYIAINALEFWLVIHRYITHAKKSDDTLPSFDELIIQSVGDEPSHGGYVVNLFYNIAVSRAIRAVKASSPMNATSNPTDLTANLQFNCMICLASAGLILLCLALACSASTAAIAFSVIGSISLLVSAGLFAYKKFLVRDEETRNQYLLGF